MPNKKDINWNTPQYRNFELTNFGLSIDPSYTGKDLFDFKSGSKHIYTKRKIKRIG